MRRTSRIRRSRGISLTLVIGVELTYSHNFKFYVSDHQVRLTVDLNIRHEFVTALLKAFRYG